MSEVTENVGESSRGVGNRGRHLVLSRWRLPEKVVGVVVGRHEVGARVVRWWGGIVKVEVGGAVAEDSS